MAQCVANSQFSLLWNAHRKNICDGLATLQQNGEFVDMTLAADGHFVKVHQLIMALASPYLKELVSSAQCPHPVIFLNKVSYKTLCAMLEYVYTGEVVVSMDDIKEFLQACKELHIKGLEDMKVHDTLSNSQPKKEDEIYYTTQNEGDIYFEIADSKPEYSEDIRDMDESDIKILSTETLHCNQDEDINEASLTRIIDKNESNNSGINHDLNTSMQYTVSNQGSLQMILNRYVYYLKHTNRNNTRQWRCVDYLNHVKCPALVFTRNDMVMQRISAHTHPFHDKRILKKLKSGAIFTAIKEAEENGKSKKNQDISSD